MYKKGVFIQLISMIVVMLGIFFAGLLYIIITAWSVLNLILLIISKGYKKDNMFIKGMVDTFVVVSISGIVIILTMMGSCMIGARQ